MSTPTPDPTLDPPAVHRAELRDAAYVDQLGGTRVLYAAQRAGRIFDTLEGLIAAGYDPDTRRPRPEPTPPAA